IGSMGRGLRSSWMRLRFDASGFSFAIVNNLTISRVSIRVNERGMSAPDTSRRLCQCEHIAGGNPAFDDRGDVGCPRIESCAFFTRQTVPLIHARNTATTAADMVQNCFRHFEPHAKPLQAGGDGAA